MENVVSPISIFRFQRISRIRFQPYWVNFSHKAKFKVSLAYFVDVELLEGYKMLHISKILRSLCITSAKFFIEVSVAGFNNSFLWVL